jgi:hypothetical protein
MAIAKVPLADSWAVRELTICVRDINELPLYARQLVEHLRAPDVRSGDAGEGKGRTEIQVGQGHRGISTQ